MRQQMCSCGSRLSRWVVSLVGAAALGLAAPSLVYAQEPSFEATAAVPLQGPEELVRARAQALSDALGRALEQGVAQVAPEARSRLYLILGRAREYITNYRVLEEGEQAGQFQVRVAVQLDLSRLLRDLQAAPRAAAAGGRPPMMVCSPSPAFEVQAAVAAARTLLDERALATETLTAAACTARLRAEASGQGRPAPLLFLQPDPTPRSEQIRGTQPSRSGAFARAEWLFYAAAPSQPGAVAADAGVLRDSGEATVFQDSPATALIEAQRQAALGGLNRLLQRPGVLTAGSTGVLLTLESVGSYTNYQQLLRALAALPGVSRVEPRRFSIPPATAKASGDEERVQVLLHTATSAETIGAALGRTPLSGLRLQVAPVGPSELRVLCAPVSALPDAVPLSPSDESPPEARPVESEGAGTP